MKRRNFSRDYPPKFHLKNNLVKLRKSSFCNQQKFMTALKKEADVGIEASFLVSCNIARAKRPYSDGDLFYIKRTACLSS